MSLFELPVKDFNKCDSLDREQTVTLEKELLSLKLNLFVLFYTKGVNCSLPKGIKKLRGKSSITPTTELLEENVFVREDHTYLKRDFGGVF